MLEGKTMVDLDAYPSSNLPAPTASKSTVPELISCCNVTVVRFAKPVLAHTHTLTAALVLHASAPLCLHVKTPRGFFKEYVTYILMHRHTNTAVDC